MREATDTQAQAAPAIAPALLTDRQAAEYCSIGKTSLWQMVATGEFPAPVQLPGRKTRWRRADVDEWIEALPSGK